MRLHTGWLSPTGEFIQCDYMSHAATAQKIVEKYEVQLGHEITEDDFLFQAGWIEIGFNMLGKQEYYILFETPLTDIQIRYLQNILDKEDKLDFPIGWLSKNRIEHALGGIDWR